MPRLKDKAQVSSLGDWMTPTQKTGNISFLGIVGSL